MNRGGLDAAGLVAFHTHLRTSHVRRTEVRLLDLSHNYLTSMHPRINSGQVNVDADADVTRSATLELDDPQRSIQFDADSPTAAPVYLDRMAQVVEWFDIPDVGEFQMPVVTGRIVKLDRTADILLIEVQGKEEMARDGVPTMTMKRGHNAVDAIHDFLAERCGETKFSFPTTKHRLPKNTVVSWEDDHAPWVVCKRIADSIGLQLFYNGNGVCILRDKPAHRVFTFRSGDDDSNITSQVQTSHDSTTGVYNRVRVNGSNKHHVAELNLDSVFPGNALGPYRQRRNGVPRFKRKVIAAPHIRSRSAARKRAVEELKHMALMEFGVSFNALPVPHLDELDMIHIDTDEYVSTERLRQWSYALGGGEMTVGFNDLRSLPRRKNKP